MFKLYMFYVCFDIMIMRRMIYVDKCFMLIFLCFKVNVYLNWNFFVWIIRLLIFVWFDKK